MCTLEDEHKEKYLLFQEADPGVTFYCNRSWRRPVRGVASLEVTLCFRRQPFFSTHTHTKKTTPEIRRKSFIIKNIDLFRATPAPVHWVFAIFPLRGKSCCTRITPNEQSLIEYNSISSRYVEGHAEKLQPTHRHTHTHHVARVLIRRAHTNKLTSNENIIRFLPLSILRGIR